jgi:hypothetical protein
VRCKCCFHGIGIPAHSGFSHGADRELPKDPGCRHCGSICGGIAAEMQYEDPLRRWRPRSRAQGAPETIRDVVWIQSHRNMLRVHLHNASYEYRMTMKDDPSAPKPGVLPSRPQECDFGFASQERCTVSIATRAVAAVLCFDRWGQNNIEYPVS